MQRKKHKRKMNHVVIVTTDAVDANVKQFRIRPWILQTIILILCVVIGALIGYLNYEKQVWDAMNQKNISLQASVEQLEAANNSLDTEKKAAEAEIVDLNDQIQILSETINQKMQTESELLEKLESQSLPTEFPLTGSSTMEEELGDDYLCLFNTSVGTTVVATAKGTVTAVNVDVEYGHSIWVDHGNGYITIYKNEGDVTVQEGDAVVKGSTLYVVGEEDLKLGYQMKKDGEYINPMDMLAING